MPTARTRANVKGATATPARRRFGSVWSAVTVFGKRLIFSVLLGNRKDYYSTVRSIPWPAELRLLSRARCVTWAGTCVTGASSTA